MKPNSRLLFASMASALAGAFPGEYDQVRVVDDLTRTIGDDPKPREKTKEDEERILAAAARNGRRAMQRAVHNIKSRRIQHQKYNQLLA